MGRGRMAVDVGCVGCVGKGEEEDGCCSCVMVGDWGAGSEATTAIFSTSSVWTGPCDSSTFRVVMVMLMVFTALPVYLPTLGTGTLCTYIQCINCTCAVLHT